MLPCSAYCMGVLLPLSFGLLSKQELESFIIRFCQFKNH